MSGHSKWASIKHKKAVVDQRRGQHFTKLARAITVAAREGGGDTDGNPSLALAVQKARDASMPKDNIERAIAKGTGDGVDADQIETVLYEGYGPGGVALLIEALTDNRNRTGADVRHALSKHGGNLGEPGSVSYLFDKRGVIVVDAVALRRGRSARRDRRRRPGHRRSTTTCSRSSPSPETSCAVRGRCRRPGSRSRAPTSPSGPRSRVPVAGGRRGSAA